MTAVLDQHPDFIILLLGANDSVCILSLPGYTLQTFENNYLSILNSFSSATNDEGNPSTVLVSTVTPCLDNGFGEEDLDNPQAVSYVIANQVNPWIRWVAASRGLPLVDSYADIKEQPDWTLFYYFPSDVIHPGKVNATTGQRGYCWMAENFRNVLLSLSPTAPPANGDFDGDGDSDGFDFLTFANCYNGSARLPPPLCSSPRTDFDGDADVDGFDFLTFANCYNGSDRSPACQ